MNAFAEDFGDDESVRYLEKMAAATGRWGELINTANAWLGEQTETDKKIQLCLRLGKWYGEDLGHPEYAQPYYGQVMQLVRSIHQNLEQQVETQRLLVSSLSALPEAVEEEGRDAHASARRRRRQ